MHANALGWSRGNKGGGAGDEMVAPGEGGGEKGLPLFNRWDSVNLLGSPPLPAGLVLVHPLDGMGNHKSHDS